MVNQGSQLSNQSVKLTIEEFKHEEHFEFLACWLKLRDKNTEIAFNLPHFGYICFQGPMPVAVAFLRQIEGDMGMFEGLCSNPECGPELRSEAIDGLIQQLIETARGIGIKSVLAWSKDKNTLERSLRHGFKEDISTMITLDLLHSQVVH
jgi:hypothetical protein